MKKIIVAGGGHGGIAAASLLASRGYDVTVCEKNSAGKLGYDWTDIFDPKSLAEIEMPMPAADKYEYKEHMTFYAPGFHTALRQDIPQKKLEIKMERSDIYAHIISNAEKNGAKFIYDCEVLAPITAGDRVVGIKTSRGDVYGDLVIDACGIDSPVKRGLPKMCGVNPEVGKNNQFYVYRAFYNKASDEEVKDKYKVCLFAEGKLGIGWVATEAAHTDLLIGRFAPFDLDEANRTANYYRSGNPSLGTDLVRGGQFVKIPVRQPLSKLVCHGYAAIGDCAYMTVPIIGSGIANSFRAARLLADTVTADTDGAYSAETLWDYQVKYYKRLGSGFAVLACVKEALTLFTPDELDYLFDNGVITAKDMSIDADTTNIFDIMSGNTFDSYKTKVVKVVKDPKLLKKILKVGRKISGVMAATAVMPRQYSKTSVDGWVARYERAISAEL
ncbi:MAG: NAD(P)-binding protein [Clostridia bacterium]|nr:NAD(P)-binding protein [Clostridia bacterium]